MMLLAYALVTGSHRVWSAEPQTNEVLTVILELSDGSRVVGTPGIEVVPVQTAYAKINVSLKQIVAIKIGDDHETAALDLQNGDKVKGVIGLSPVQLDTVFGKVSVGIEHVREFRIVRGGGLLPPGEGPLAFGGVNWIPWRTLFEVQGDKLVSLPKVRPGFNYGHGGNGRGPGIMTNIGDTNWKDYSVEFDFCMRGVDPALNPHGLPLDFRGGGIVFHVADAKESWNECGGSGYNLSFSGDGAWSLGCAYNQYCRVPAGYGNARNDGERKLAEGKGLTLDPQNGNRIRIDVSGARIQIWVDNSKIVDLRDEKMTETIGGKTLDHWGHWLRRRPRLHDLDPQLLRKTIVTTVDATHPPCWRPGRAPRKSDFLSLARKSGATTIIGSGDSAKTVKKAGMDKQVTFVSTGGGAALIDR